MLFENRKHRKRNRSLSEDDSFEVCGCIMIHFGTKLFYSFCTKTAHLLNFFPDVEP